MTDLDALTADQLRALFARTRDATTRRAIQRRLQQLDDQPPPAPPPPRKPQMHAPEFRDRLLGLRPPTTRPWWSLAQITDALDRTTVEWHDKKGKK